MHLSLREGLIRLGKTLGFLSIYRSVRVFAGFYCLVAEAGFLLGGMPGRMPGIWVLGVLYSNMLPGSRYKLNSSIAAVGCPRG